MDAFANDITHKFLQSQSVSQSVNVLSSFKCRSVMVVFKKRGEIIFQLKRRLKR